MLRFIYSIDSENSGSTSIDNLFINEYMHEAKGDYVKVYLYGMMCSQNNSDKPISFENIVRQIGIPAETVQEALDYWVKKDIVQIRSDGSDNFYYFRHLPSLLTSKPQKKESAEALLSDIIRVAEQITGQPTLSFNYVSAITTWLEQYHFERDLILDLIKESQDLDSQRFKDDHSRLNYIKKVAENWNQAGITTLAEAETYTETFKNRNRIMYQVLKKLGSNRGIMESEREAMNNWFEQFGFDEEIIFEAVRRSNVPRINYVNSILERWHNLGVRTFQEIPPEDTGYSQQELSQSEKERLEAVEGMEKDLIANYKRLLEEYGEE